MSGVTNVTLTPPGPFPISPTQPPIYTRTLGNKSYELDDHLGNVLMTVSDRKIPNGTVGGNVTYFNADVLSGNDYYPFGQLISARRSIYGNYRFAYNGKEKEDEIYSPTNAYDYGARMYDSRLGRFMSVDPLIRSYPYLTPYQFASDRPIDGIDLEGAEYLKSDEARIEVNDGKIALKVENFNWITKKDWEIANENPNNWTYTNGVRDIGINPSIGNVNFVQPKDKEYAAEEPAGFSDDENPGYNPSQVKVENPTTKQSNYTEEDQRYNSQTVSGASGMSAAAGRGLIVLDAINAAIKYGGIFAGMYEQSKVNSNFNTLKDAIFDVNTALGQGNKIIPEKYQNVKDLSVIVNVVLEGVNNSNNPELYNIGMKIYNEISKVTDHSNDK